MRSHLWLIGLAIAVVSAVLALLLHAETIAIVILCGVAAGIGIFVAGVMIRERQHAKEVQQAIRKFAEKHGFTFIGSRRAEQMPATRISLFHRGDRRRWKNVCEGEVNGHRGYFGTFEYFESDRRGGAWLDYQVALFPGEVKGMPEFLLDPEGILDRFIDLFRGRDINFADSDVDRKFSNNYDLRGPDHDAIRTVFDEERRTFFAKHPGWCAKSLKGDLAIWREGNIADCFYDRSDSSVKTMEEWLSAELSEMTEVARQLLPARDNNGEPTA